MILLNVIYVYLHTNQIKYIILSLFIYFFFTSHFTLFHFFPFNLLSIKGERGRVCNLPPPPLLDPPNSLSISPPPPPHTISLSQCWANFWPMSACQHLQCANSFNHYPVLVQRLVKEVCITPFLSIYYPPPQSQRWLYIV